MADRFVSSLQVKLFLAFFAISVIVAGSLSFLHYKSLSEDHFSHLQRELKLAAAIASLQVDGTVLEKLILPEQSEDEEYQSIKNTLNQIASRDSRIKYIYTLRQTDQPGIFTFIVDADPDPASAAYIGQIYDGRQLPAMAQGFIAPSVDNELVRDRWGVTLSGYAPVYNQEGKVVASLGIDVDASTVNHDAESVLGKIIKYFLVLICFVGVASYHMAVRFSQRLNQINHAVQSLSQGNLAIKLDINGKDEIDSLAHSINDLIKSLHTEREEALFSAIAALVNALEAKDSYTYGHSSEVSTIAVQIARDMGLHDQEVFQIHFAALLHDIGKIGVPDHVLNKAGKLTDDEWDQIKEHPRIGARIIAGIPALQEITRIVLHHHERWDGKGYPEQIKGETIPLGARIIAVADTYQAMVSDRPYRKGMDKHVALEEIVRCAGTQFDPHVAKVFIERYKKD